MACAAPGAALAYGHKFMTMEPVMVAKAEILMPAGEFKARCLKLMDQVQATGRPIVITKRGKPVAKLVPAEEAAASLFGRMRGEITIHGDIVGPTGEEWNAEKGILYVGEDDCEA
jgi:prevent-host-death family protein